MYRIMLADDEGIMLEALKNIITSNFGDECEIATAKTGRAVVELAESFRPDIAFMDIQMPGLNGYDTARMIRHLERADAKTIPIIAMTANAFAEDVQAAGYPYQWVLPHVHSFPPPVPPGHLPQTHSPS